MEQKNMSVSESYHNSDINSFFDKLSEKVTAYLDAHSNVVCQEFADILEVIEEYYGKLTA